jgi:hypothetical protein
LNALLLLPDAFGSLILLEIVKIVLILDLRLVVKGLLGLGGLLVSVIELIVIV